MQKILQKNKKKNKEQKIGQQVVKHLSQYHRESKQCKQGKQIIKQQHHSSTLTLVSHHNTSYISNKQLVDVNKKKKQKKSKNYKHCQSCLSVIYRQIKQNQKKNKHKDKTLPHHKKNPSTKSTKKMDNKIPQIKNKKNPKKLQPKITQKYNTQILHTQHKSQQQLYQKINIDLLKSQSNSQIIFSNRTSIQSHNSRYLINPNKYKNIFIINSNNQHQLNKYCHHHHQFLNYNQLQLNAAIKIQKIYRGYMTRKILKMHIQNIDNGTPSQQQNQVSQRNQQRHIINRKLIKQNQLSFNQVLSHTKLNKLTQNANNQFSDAQQQYHQKFFNIQPIDCTVKKYRKQDTIHSDKGQDSLNKYYTSGQKCVTVHDSKQQQQIDKQKCMSNDKQNQSQQLDCLKLTQTFSSQQCKSKSGDPQPTDFSQQKVHQFENEIIYQSIQQQKNKLITQNKTQRQNSNTKCNTKTANQKKQKNKVYKYFTIHEKQPAVSQKNQQNKLSQLKKAQKQKWNKIIQILNEQIKYIKQKNYQNQQFIKVILDLSKKNQSSLHSLSPLSNQSNTQKNIGFKQKEKINHGATFQPNHSDLEKEELSNHHPVDDEVNNPQKSANSQNTVLLLQQAQAQFNDRHESESQYLMKKTQQLKVFYNQKHEAYPIEQMIEIREKALQKRQKQMINNLHEELSRRKLSHEQFLTRLSEIQQKYEKQRELINKTKLQIFVGYQATKKLIQNSYKDAWYLGFRVPFSQSLKNIRNYFKTHNIWSKDLIVDELKNYKNKSIQTKDNIKKSNKNQNNIRVNYEKINNINLSSSQLLQNYQKKQQQLKNINKKQDLSILIPSEDNKFKFKFQNHQHLDNTVLCSQQILYDQREEDIYQLCTKDKTQYKLQSSSENEQQQQKKGHKIQGFRKIDIPSHSVHINHSLINQNQVQIPLILDPAQQQYIDNIVMKKISINQRRRLDYQNFDNFQNMRKNQMTPRNMVQIYSKLPKSEIYKVDLGDQSSENCYNCHKYQDKTKQIKQITEIYLYKLIWEVVNELYLNEHIRQKYFQSRNKYLEQITHEQQSIYIKYLQEQIPKFNQNQLRLNSKIPVSRIELLKFLRVNFEDGDQNQIMERNENEEICYDDENRKIIKNNQCQETCDFQHPISIQGCTNAINRFLDIQNNIQNVQNDWSEQRNQQLIFDKMIQQFKQQVSIQCIKIVVEREKSYAKNKMYRKNLRREVVKTQFHCIYDMLNQTIIKERLKCDGYSGIGLNQLTMVIGNERIKQITTQGEYKKLIKKSIEQSKELLSIQKTSEEKLLLENYEQLCENDSQWIYYTEEALSFILEFVYMLEDEIFFEEATCIFKRGKNI